MTGLERASIEIVQAVIWSCLAMSVLLADIVNDGYEIRLAAMSRATSPARARGAAAAVAPSPS